MESYYQTATVPSPTFRHPPGKKSQLSEYHDVGTHPLILSELRKAAGHFEEAAFTNTFINSTLLFTSPTHTLIAKEKELTNIFWKKGEMCIRDLVNSLPEPRLCHTTVSICAFPESKGFLYMQNNHIFVV